MADVRFHALSDAELADLWYALSGADIRHPDCFKSLTDATMKELESRQGAALSAFLDARFARFRAQDAADDVEATRKSMERCDPPAE